MNNLLLAAVALSVSGGLISYIGGRRILRHEADPLFTDLVFAHRLAMVRIHTVMVVVVGFLAGAWANALMLLYFLSVAAGGFPARKRIFNETWSLTEYLISRIRAWFFIGGIWFAILYAPFLLRVLGLSWWPAILIALTLVFLAYERLLLFGFDSRPFVDEAFNARIAPLLARAAVTPPALFIGGPRSGTFANAFTLPRGRQPRILFMHALVRELSDAEMAAIFGHELAHAEHYAKRSRQISMLFGRIVIPALAVGAPAIAMATESPMASAISLIWPLVFIVSMTIAVIRRQKHETEADLRALDFGADPHAMISALEKIHALNRTPRRWNASRERKMTHPSLARRIDAIRRKAGLQSEVAAPQLPAVVRDRKGNAVARFTEEGIQVVKRPSDASEDETFAGLATLRYESFQSLILRPSLGALQIVGEGEKTVRVSIDPAASAAVSEILTWAEGRLSPTTAVTRPARMSRLVAAALLGFALLPGITFPPLIASILAFVIPSPATLAALGATALAAAGLAMTPSLPRDWIDVVPTIALIVALLGIVCLVLSRRFPRDDRSRYLRLTIIILGALAALVALPVIAGIGVDEPLQTLILLTRERPSIAALLAGICASLLIAGRRREAATAGVAALLFFACSTRPAGMAAKIDPLLNSREPSWVAAPAPRLTRKLGEHAFALQLSPDARSICIRTTGRNGQEVRTGPIDGPLQTTTDCGEPIEEDEPRISIASAAGALDLPPSLGMFAARQTDIWDRQSPSRTRIGRSIFYPLIVTHLPGTDAWALLGNDKDGTYVGILDAASGAIRPAGMLPEHATQMRAGNDSRVVIVTYEGTAVVWNLRTMKAMRLDRDADFVTEASFGDGVLGVLWYGPKGAEVTLYSTAAIGR